MQNIREHKLSSINFQTQNNMEKILISNDSNKATRMINELQEKCNKVNRVIQSVFNSNDIPLTAENFQTAVFYPQKIESVYYATLNEKIKSFPQVLQVTARQEAEYAVNSMLKKLNSFELTYTDKQYIILSGTTCKVNEAAIKESCKRYLTDAKEIEVYNNIQEAANALNKLFKGEIPLNWINIFRADNGKLVVNDGLNFDYFVNRK